MAFHVNFQECIMLIIIISVPWQLIHLVLYYRTSPFSVTSGAPYITGTY